MTRLRAISLNDSITTTYSITIEPAGWQFDAPNSVSLLAAARLAQIDLPASCRNGTCRTCMCRLVSGSIRYSIEWPGLSAEEKAEGLLLPCVAHAASDLVITVPGAKVLKRG
jgi:ferredoxin